MDLAYCERLDDQTRRDGCLALFQLWQTAKWDRDRAGCAVFQPAWPELGRLCEQSFDLPARPYDAADHDDLASVEDRNLLLVRGADGRYEDRAEALGVDIGGIAWNAKFADLDNDGWQDIYLVNGFLLGMSTGLGTRLHASNILFHNRGGSGFEDATEDSGLTAYTETAAYTYADLDNDGDLDIVTVPMFGPLSVYENRGARGNAIAVALRDARGNRFGIGARVVIALPDGSRQMRELQASGGYLSYDAPVAHFGLGDQDRVERIEVAWADGSTSRVEGPFAAGSAYVLTRDAP
jgi:hypothetical protein